MMNRERYILSQIKEESTELVNLEMTQDEFSNIQAAADKLNLSLDAFIQVSLREKLIDVEKERHSKEYDNIIDIYEFGMNVDKYIESGLVYLVINPNGKHVILLPVDEYEKIYKKDS